MVSPPPQEALQRTQRQKKERKDQVSSKDGG